MNCNYLSYALYQVWAKGREWYDTKFAPKLGPIALVSLLYTIFVIFALQGRQVFTIFLFVINSNITLHPG